MARKAKTQTVTGPNSRTYPCPSYWGLTGKPWSKMEALAQEQANLSERYNKLGQERMQLVEELNYQRQRYYDEQTKAARLDEPDPEDKYIVATEKAIERTERKMQAIRQASDEVDLDHNRAMQELREAEGLVEELVSKARAHEQEYLEHVAKAEVARDQMGLFLGISRYVAGIQEEFGVPRTDPVGNLWYQQRIQWPGDPEPDPTISTVTAGALL